MSTPSGNGTDSVRQYIALASIRDVAPNHRDVRLTTLQGFEEIPQFGEADKNVDRAEDGDPGAKEIVQHQWAKE